MNPLTDRRLRKGDAPGNAGTALLRAAPTCQAWCVSRRSDAEPRAPEAPPGESPLDPRPSDSGAHPLERWLPEVIEVAARGAAAPAASSLAMARVVSMGPPIKILLRGAVDPVDAELDDGVDHRLVVGLLQRKSPERITLKAAQVVIEGEREVLLKSGSAALRLREDGDVELVGSRIVSASRGLFRLVGRVLRLN
jgi:hypothetical protein